LAHQQVKRLEVLTLGIYLVLHDQLLLRVDPAPRSAPGTALTAQNLLEGIVETLESQQMMRLAVQ
jgi:hypothetical protein